MVFRTPVGVLKDRNEKYVHVHVGRTSIVSTKTAVTNLVWMLLLDKLVRFLQLLELVEQEGLVFPLLMGERREDEEDKKSVTQNFIAQKMQTKLTFMICCRSCVMRSLRP